MIKNTFLWPIFQWLQLRRLQLPRVYSTFEGSSFSSIDREKVTLSTGKPWPARKLLTNRMANMIRTQSDWTRGPNPNHFARLWDLFLTQHLQLIKASVKPLHNLTRKRTNIRFRFHNPNFLILDFTWFETTQAWHTTPRQLAHPQLDPNVNIQITRPLGLEPVVGGQLSGG